MEKVIIYLRTSTEDQEPENQKRECLKFAEDRGYDIQGVMLERLSGFKQIDRPKYERIKEMARKGEIKAVIVSNESKEEALDFSERYYVHFCSEE